MKKTVLITGASGGIGSETAILFAKAGYQTVLHYNKNKAGIEKIADMLKGLDIITVSADITKREQVISMFDKIKSRFGGVDILINNAGIAQQKLFTDITDDEWDNMFAVNMKGMFYCTQEALPHMIHQKWGRIINISSIWGISGASCEVHYSAAKAAVIGFTKALAKEEGPSNITVNCVAPGVINTEMNQNLDEETIKALKEETPLGIIGKGQDVGEMILFLASNKADFITGQVISPNGGIVI